MRAHMAHGAPKKVTSCEMRAFRGGKKSSFPRRKARAKDTQHHKNPGEQNKRNPEEEKRAKDTPHTTESWGAGSIPKPNKIG